MRHWGSPSGRLTRRSAVREDLFHLPHSPIAWQPPTRRGRFGWMALLWRAGATAFGVCCLALLMFGCFQALVWMGVG